jgi:hypothetical protein
MFQIFIDDLQLRFYRWRAPMSASSTVLPRVIARVGAGVVVAALLLRADATNFPTQCFAHDNSIAGNERPTSHNFAFGYLEFERMPERNGELRLIGENAPAHESSAARAEELMNSILNWLVTKFDLPAIREAPRIEFIQPALMAQLRYRGSASNQGMTLDMGRDIVAVYDDANRTIHLPEGWTGVTPAEQSLLVHEMVHHLQNLGKLKYECSEAREKLAFAAQEQWLGLFGRSLSSEFDIDPFTLKVKTVCGYWSDQGLCECPQ